jgi:magnesium chelatase family protein
MITVESDTNHSVPTIDIIWLPDTAIKESKERIRSTFRRLNIKIPNIKFILNLAPSHIRKVGTSFDLAMALAILCNINTDVYHRKLIDQWLFFGELGLDGEVKRINWLLPIVLSARSKWFKYFFVPSENIYELEYVPDIYIFGISNFSQIVDIFSHGHESEYIYNLKKISDLANISAQWDVDFGHIKWQLVAKRSLSIAAAWLHNTLMVWAPWSGKTLMSRALQSILPPLTSNEILEVSQMYSIIGKLDKDTPLIINRPFRNIHHTASKVSLVWWWSNLQPWEISLAHRGILFMDELTEFGRDTLDVLRQPLEDKKITISRASGSVSYPADFMLVAAMNPCKCGFYKDPEKPCICNILDIKRYQSRISWPLLDRIDMILEIPRENIDSLLDRNQISENSQSIRAKVIQAHNIQQKRFSETNITNNSQISSKDIDKYILMESKAEEFLKNWARKLILSPRVVHRIMKLARSIADMDGNEIILLNHIAEAFQYRNKNMFIDENM